LRRRGVVGRRLRLHGRRRRTELDHETLEPVDRRLK
jgi:hypothetical protein